MPIVLHFLAEETPAFIARHLVSRLTQYAETLKTPFFVALVDYAEQAISSGPVPATTAASSIAEARSAASSWSIWAKRSSATTSTIRSQNLATSSPTKARRKSVSRIRFPALKPKCREENGAVRFHTYVVRE
jgi:hypothetical protein